LNRLFVDINFILSVFIYIGEIKWLNDLKTENNRINGV